MGVWLILGSGGLSNGSNPDVVLNLMDAFTPFANPGPYGYIVFAVFWSVCPYLLGLRKLGIETDAWISPIAPEVGWTGCIWV